MTDVIDLTPLPPRLRGIPRKRLLHYFVRELCSADIALLEVHRHAPAVPHVQRLRDSHHRLARLLAAGKKNVDAAAMSGYSLGRIQQLRDDPAFADLVEVYRKEINEDFNEYADLATANLVRGEMLIADALEHAMDKDEPLTLSELRPIVDIVEGRQDRFGFPKQTVNHNVSHDFAGKLEAARKRSGLAPPPAKPEAPLVEGVKKEPVAR